MPPGHGMTILPPGTDGPAHLPLMHGNTGGSSAASSSSSSSTSTIITTASGPASTVGTPRLEPWPASPSFASPHHQQSLPSPHPRVSERPSFGNIRASFRDGAGAAIAALAQTTVRAVTPDPVSDGAPAAYRSYTSPSSPKRQGYVSPRPLPLSVGALVGPVPHPGIPRRKTADDDISAAARHSTSPPPLPPRPRAQPIPIPQIQQQHHQQHQQHQYQHQQQQQQQQQPQTFRPRNRTMDAGSLRQHMPPGTGAMSTVDHNRHRMGSVSSSGSQGYLDEMRFSPPPHEHPFTSPTLPPRTAAAAFEHPPPPHPPPPPPYKDKKSAKAAKRFAKRSPSRPPSPPNLSLPAYVDSLPIPVSVEDATKVLLLMRNLCGRMRGEIEYQIELGTTWVSGMGYVEEERGALMVDTGSSPFHTNLIPDLRGCRVMPVDYPGLDRPCLELVCATPQLEVLVRPRAWEEADLWLAALLCWQQVRPTTVRMADGKPVPFNASRPELRRHVAPSSAVRRPTNIIKMGNLLLWDKGLAATPRGVVRRPSARDVRAPANFWRRVSCTLHDNGDFRLLSDHDGSVLTTIELSQLSRCAVQKLDGTVLDEDHCVGIFPLYHSTSSQLSVFRPVYLALDGRENYEVWFVLLRAFTLPDIFRIDPSREDQVSEIRDFDDAVAGDIFRIEKSVTVRVTEAKIVPRSGEPPGPDRDRSSKGGGDPDASHNYLAEVLLDGEVRARTTTKTGTKNPFWREDSQFLDLPSMTPFFLSVLLKRVDGIPAPESPASPHLPSTPTHRPMTTTPTATTTSSTTATNSSTTTATATTTAAAAATSTTTATATAATTTTTTASTREVAFGAVDIPLDRMDTGKDHEQWLQIYDERQRSVGSMLVRVHHEELVVLAAAEYRALSELLHRFPAGLTAQIAAALPGQLRRLSETFLDIFQVTHSAADWLMTLVEDEIDGIGGQSGANGGSRKFRFNGRLKSSSEPGGGGGGGGGGISVGGEQPASSGDREQIVRDLGKSLTGEANLLFRGNSLLTQALEFHMRRLGGEYLVEALRDKLFEINELNPDCEVDPTRLASPDDAPPRWARLLQLTTEVWQCIRRSVDRIPVELREVFSYIRTVAEHRYGDFLRNVPYTSVSGFIFLRFVCPAILSPKLFGLLRDHPRPRAQRTFTIIAKSLQKLANLSTFGRREEWMEPMNKFLSGHRGEFREFIDIVCTLPPNFAASGSGGVVGVRTAPVPAPYSTPTTILGRLPPARREGFPTLPYLIDHPRNFAALAKMWSDANPLGGVVASGEPGAGAAHDPDSDLRVFNDVCVSIQRRADGCLARVEVLRAAAEVSSASTASSSAARLSLDDLSESLGRSSFGEFVGGGSPHAGPATPSWAEGGGDDRPPGSSGSEGAAGAATNNPESSSSSSSSSTTTAGRRKDVRARARAASSAVGQGMPVSGLPGDSLALTGLTQTTVTSGGSSNGSRGYKTGAGGRTTRMILSGIMRMGNRPSSPDQPTSKTSTRFG